MILAIRTTPGATPIALAEPVVARGGVTELRLGPVSLGVLHQLVLERVGTALTRPQVTRLEAASSGNPLVAIEIARELARRETWPLPGEPMPIPASASALLEERIGRMSAGDREVLFAVAATAVPTVGQVRLVVAEADMPLEHARSEGLIEVDGHDRIHFIHPLMASAALLAIPVSERRRLHARLAEIATTLEDRGRHLALATDPPSADAAAALDAAATSARSRGATAVAAEWAERAVAMTPSDDRAAWTARATRAGRWLAEAGEIGRARTLLTEAMPSMPAGDGRAAARLVLAQMVAWEGEAEAALMWCEAGLEEAVDAALRARLLLRIAFQTEDLDTSRAIEATEAAIAELDGPAGDAEPDLLACALLQVATLRLATGAWIDRPSVERGIALLGPAPRLSPDGDELPESLRAHAMVWARAVDLDDLAGGFALQQAERERNLARGLDRALPVVIGEMTMTALWMGDWSEATTRADEARAMVGQTGATTQARSAALAARAFVDAYRGNLAAAETGARAGLELSADAGDWLKARHVAVLGFLALTRGEAADAATILGTLFDEFRAGGNREMLGHRFVGDLIDAAAAAGDIDRLRTVTESLATSESAVPRPWIRTMAARGRALLTAADGDLDGAMTAIEAALEHADTLPMPFEHARTELIAGRIARRRKERRRATDHLERAQATFADLGSAPWVAIASAEMARTGRRAAATDALTETEERVARLAASGLTNREVGEAAFLTPKSVEGVLARVYSKLGIRSRAELGAWLAAHPDAQDHRSEAPDPAEAPGPVG